MTVIPLLVYNGIWLLEAVIREDDGSANLGSYLFNREKVILNANDNTILRPGAVLCNAGECQEMPAADSAKSRRAKRHAGR